MNNKIDINSAILADVIKNLKDDNIKIVEIEKNIRTIVSKLDNNVWNSSEKYDVIYNFIPYLENCEQKTTSNLDNCVGLLEIALNKYLEADNVLKSNVNKIEEL